MTDLDLKKKCEELKSLFSKAPIKKTCSMELNYDEDGSAIFTMPYNESFNHALGGTHGGIIATMLDNAGWFTAATQFDFWISTTDLHVQLLLPVSHSGLRSKGFLIKSGRKMAFTKMEVFDDQDQLVAIGSGTFLVTSKPLL